MEVKALIDRATVEACLGRVRALTFLVVAVVAAIALLALPAPSLAQTTFGSPGSGAGELNGPYGVAVDQSSGDVYVADGRNQRVDVFASDGTFIRAFGWGVADGASKLETCTATCQQGLSGSGAGQFKGPVAVAVDQSSHDVYVIDNGNYRVEKFDPSGSFILMLGGEVDKTGGGNVCTAASGHTCGAGVQGNDDGEFNTIAYGSPMAVDGSGTVYVGDRGAKNVQRIQEFGADGRFSGTLQSSGMAYGGQQGQPVSITVDPKGNVYVLEPPYGLRKYNALDQLLRELDATGAPQALAMDGDSDLFVRDSAGGSNRVLEYDPAGDRVNSLSLGSVVDPGSSSGIAYNDSTQTLYAADSRSDHVIALSTAPPPGPFIAPDSDRATDVGYTDATLNAIINPQGSAVGYHFEYGLTSSYGQSTPAGTLAAKQSFLKVKAYLPGLAPFTTYHFRIVVGGMKGRDETFTTYALPAMQSCSNAAFRYGYGANLPDCRAYEQVSPMDKNHSDLDGLSTLVAPSGDATTFGSYAAFADATSGPVSLGYAATRGSDGWRTHSLTPPIDSSAQRFNAQTDEYGVAAGFTKALVMTDAALAPGAVTGLYNNNLYVKDGVNDSYTLVAAIPGQSPFPALLPALPNVTFAGAAEDASRWVFAVQAGLTGYLLDSTPAPPSGARDNLYAWSPSGGLELVGILPDETVDSKGAIPAGNADLAVAAHVVSTDGSRIYWTEAARRGPWPVFVRDGDQTKVVSHDTSGDAQPATFWYATPDGAHAFFTSDVGLKSNASAAGDDLYRYDASSGDVTDLTPDSTDPGGADVEAVFGASDDGSYVYFLATGALATGATAGRDNLYVSHDSHTRFIGALATDPGYEIPNSFANEKGLGTQYQVSADGRSFGLLFQGAISGPHSHPAQPFDMAYLYSYGDGSLGCASCLRNDATPSGAVNLGDPGASPTFGDMRGSSIVVTNGGQIFFDSPDALIPADVNQRMDVYEYERVGSGSCHSAQMNGGCVSLISSGRGVGVGTPGGGRVLEGARLAGASANGRDVFFETYDRLVGQDHDNNVDLYDARIGGGFASQAPQPPASSCTGDGCKGVVASHPSSAAPGSFRYSGPGNVHGAAHATAVFHVRALSRKQRRRLAKGRRVRLRVRVSKAGLVRAKVRGRLGRHKKVRTVAHGRHRARHGGTVKVALRLSKVTRRYLKRHRRLRIAIRVRYVHAGGVQKAHLVLRRAGSHRRGGHSRNGGRR